MAEEKDKKKGLFGKAIDALTSRDEKEELEETKKELLKAKNEAEAAKHQEKLAKMKADVASQKEAAAAKKRAEEAEKRVAELERKEKAAKAAESRKAARAVVDARRQEAAQPKYIAEHTLTAEETLSHLSLKYYGHATRPYWMVIYEANKEVIGDNPAHVRPGLVLNIPELPKELKD